MILAFTVAVAIAFATGTSVVDESHSREPSRAEAGQRAAPRTVCRDRISLRNVPAGVTIGYLQRGERVIVTVYARRHRWAYAITLAGQGWLLTSGLCRRR
jgi:hypothetical protein